jgi:Domain of unknown function (DUF4209)
VTSRDKHGLQSMIQLGSILNNKNLESRVDVQLINEAKVLFVDQHGPDLRNRIAHGLMSYEDFSTAPAIYAWWYIFFLCFALVCRRLKDEPGPDDRQFQAGGPPEAD